MMAHHEDVEWWHGKIRFDGDAEVAEEEGARLPSVAQNECHGCVVATEVARQCWRVHELEYGVADHQPLSAPRLVGADPAGSGQRPQSLVECVAGLWRPRNQQADRERLEYGDEAFRVIGVSVGVDDYAQVADAERPQRWYYDARANVVVGEGRPSTIDQHVGAGTYAQEGGISLANVEEPDVGLGVPCWQRVSRTSDHEADRKDLG